MKPTVLFLCGAVLFLLAGFPPAGARTWRVLPDGTGDAPTIQAGLDSAVIGDVVEVACGTYHEHDLAMRSGVTLRSQTGTPDCVTIDAESLGRGLVCLDLDPSAVIEGFTITGGVTTGSVFPDHAGGGMICDDASPSVNNCAFADNVAYGEGGGVACVGESYPQFANCAFVDNAVYANGSGGGLTCWYGATPTLVHCLVARNSASVGGGLFFWIAGADLGSCTVTENQASTGGGVALFGESRLTAFNTEILHNDAALGADGSVGDGAEALLTCCEVDLIQWEGSGTIVLDNEGCGPIPATVSTWGAVKAMFRD